MSDFLSQFLGADGCAQDGSLASANPVGALMNTMFEGPNAMMGDALDQGMGGGGMMLQPSGSAGGWAGEYGDAPGGPMMTNQAGMMGAAFAEAQAAQMMQHQAAAAAQNGMAHTEMQQAWSQGAQQSQPMQHFPPGAVMGGGGMGGSGMMMMGGGGSGCGGGDDDDADGKALRDSASSVQPSVRPSVSLAAGTVEDLDAALSKRLRLLSPWLTSCHLGVSWGGVDEPQDWQEAADQLGRLDASTAGTAGSAPGTVGSSCHTPKEKLECLVKCFELVTAALGGVLAREAVKKRQTKPRQPRRCAIDDDDHDNDDKGGDKEEGGEEGELRVSMMPASVTSSPMDSLGHPGSSSSCEDNTELFSKAFRLPPPRNHLDGNGGEGGNGAGAGGGAGEGHSSGGGVDAKKKELEQEEEEVEEAAAAAAAGVSARWSLGAFSASAATASAAEDAAAAAAMSLPGRESNATAEGDLQAVAASAAAAVSSEAERTPLPSADDVLPAVILVLLRCASAETTDPDHHPSSSSSSSSSSPHLNNRSLPHTTAKNRRSTVLAQLNAQLEYATTFRAPHRLRSSQAQYFAVTLYSAVAFLLDLEGKHLNFNFNVSEQASFSPPSPPASPPTSSEELSSEEVCGKSNDEQFRAHLAVEEAVLRAEEKARAKARRKQKRDRGRAELREKELRDKEESHKLGFLPQSSPQADNNKKKGGVPEEKAVETAEALKSAKGGVEKEGEGELVANALKTATDVTRIAQAEEEEEVVVAVQEEEGEEAQTITFGGVADDADEDNEGLDNDEGGEMQREVSWWGGF